jgi:hypothetical protein
MMKGETPLAAKTIVPPTKSVRIAEPRDRAQSQHLFADALKRADAKSQPLKKKMVEDQPGGVSITTPVDYALSASSTPPAGPVQADAAMAAHIERIAAAIAEVANSGAQAETHLQLPLGATRIDGAVLGRNDAGQMHIILTTAAVIAPATAAQMQSQLTERLLRRDIKVAKIDVQRVKRSG